MSDEANRDESGGEQGRAYALLVGFGILLSRIFGLIRERAISHYMGASPAVGAFKAALRIPNFLQNLFGEGVLSASMIPVYARLWAEGDEARAGRVAGSIALLLVLVVASLVLIGVLLSPLLVTLLAPGFHGEVRELTIRLVRILFPSAGLLVMSAWCLGILNSHRKFFLSYVAPVFWNLAMIVTLVIFGTRLRLDPLAVALAWGTVVGSVIQVCVQLPFVFSSARSIRWVLDVVMPDVREVIRNFFPVVTGRGVVQVSAFVDGIIVSFLGASTVAILSFAQTIYLIPVSLFGMSIAAAELPQMSSVVGSTEQIHRELRKRLVVGLRQMSFFVVPSALAFITIGDLLVAALYQTGRFGGADTILVWYVIATLALGLPAVTSARLCSSTFYALRDTKTPLVFATIRVVLLTIVGYSLGIAFRPWFVGVLVDRLGLPLPEMRDGRIVLGVLGVVVGNALAAWLEYSLLHRSLSKRIGTVTWGLEHQARVWGSAIAAGIAAVIGGRPAVEWIQGALAGHATIVHVASATVAATIFGLVYLIATLALGVPEARSLVRRLPMGR